MKDSKLMTGVGIVRQATAEVARRPIDAAALVLAALMTIVVAPLWGATLAWLGWLGTRERLPADGVISLGEVLAPRRAREQYRDGVWRGLWRVHGISLAFAVVQVPILLLVLAPAAVAVVLFAPAGPVFAANETVAMAVMYGVPLPVAIACGAVVAGEAVLAYRLLRSLGGPYSLGLIYRVTGAAWRVTLEHIATLVGLGFTLALGAVVFGAVVGGLAYLAGVLALGAGQLLIMMWLGALLAVVVIAVALESIARWADSVALPTVDRAGSYVFTDWLWSWLGSVFGWFAKQGMIAVGTGACLVVGLLTGIAALATGQVFTSWVGLGWFAVAAAVLVTIRLAERKS